MNYEVGLLLIISFFVVQTLFIGIKFMLLAAAIKKGVNIIERKVTNTLSSLRNDAGQKRTEDASKFGEMQQDSTKEQGQKRTPRHI